jgi:C-terminal processing protease CtpA/Prc
MNFLHCFSVSVRLIMALWIAPAVAALVLSALSACQQNAAPTTQPIVAQPAQFTDFALFRGGVLSNAAVNQAVFDRDIKDFVYAAMRDIYLWSETVRTDVNPNSYPTPEALVRDLMNREDRFTAIVRDGEAFLNQVSSNQQTIFGFRSVWLNDTSLYVASVVPNAPAGRAGLRRGMRVLRVNGTAVTRTNFSSLTQPDAITLEVEQGDGSVRSLSMQRATVNAATVLASSVFTVANKRVGYLNFDTFFGRGVEELDSVFALFKGQGVSELVLDMRYNGGGLVNIAQHLASLIAPAQSGKVVVRYAYNARYSRNNQEILFTAPTNALPNLTRVFVITSPATASASEMVINSLRPFMQVMTIGATTTGKNVGSNVIFHPRSGYAILPITFGFENALGDRNFGNGFAPTRQESDDVTRDFTDPRERCLAAALAFIERGSFPTTSADGIKPGARIAGRDGYELVRERGEIPEMPLLDMSLVDKNLLKQRGR